MKMGNWARRAVGSYFAFFIFASTLAAQESSVTVTVEPLSPVIERRNCQQLLNFDLALRNGGNDTLRLTEIEALVFDESGKVVLKKTVNSNGLRPGIEIVWPGLLHPGETFDVFNPFFSFESDVAISHLQFGLRFVVENTPEEAAANRHRLPMDFDFAIPATVRPSSYKTKTKLHLPLQGRILVWEGHDFFAHHRRVPIDADRTREIGIKGGNANRYASDLVIVNEKGEMFHDDPYVKTNYYTHGQPIYAPADGIVIKTRNDIPDNAFEGKRIRYPQLPPDVDGDLGNFVHIDHENGEFSFLPHMRLGSLRVKAGEHIRRGQELGEVGFSGDAIFPHVHYSLLSGFDVHRNEGLPAYFDQGGKRVLINHAILDTGDLVEGSAASKRNEGLRSKK